ncbi:MAG: permease-like cell division protein FtsX [Bacilli bacterium]|nr:permease-like cell division protein FtsX [Bacilli bacterium]
MKLFRMIKNGVRDAFKSVKRNFSLALASISCISITLIVVALALLVAFNVENFSSNAGENVTIVTYLSLGATEDDIREFEAALNKMENVNKEWTMQTPHERKEGLMAENDFLSSVASLIDNDEEVFHYRYDINVLDVKKLKETRDDINSLKMVDTADFGDETITKMISMFDVAGKIGFGVAIVLIIVTVFLIVNTIKLTIFSRKREISIMRVVGASNLTIKNPFIIEGFIIGLLGSIIPVLATIFGYRAFYERLDNGHLMTFWLEFIHPEPFVYFISLIIVVIGVIVGMFGSSRAVRKYLKV